MSIGLTAGWGQPALPEADEGSTRCCPTLIHSIQVSMLHIIFALNFEMLGMTPLPPWLRLTLLPRPGPGFAPKISGLSCWA